MKRTSSCCFGLVFLLFLRLLPPAASSGSSSAKEKFSMRTGDSSSRISAMSAPPWLPVSLSSPERGVTAGCPAGGPLHEAC
ncbi:hypothetical protein GDO81_021563 [Engystomops pustulosus]|uniref:Secreted protein n=1 Tax=Engystomops pustulosus TaxID=76066 RepID=A0AAV6Z736_ENGPU|nr:hypothetical protein GDO81_021563 [Engystomops pustulosus]